MRSQLAMAKLCVRVRLERVGLHQVSDQADRRLWEGVQTIVEFRLLVSNVAQLERPSALVNQVCGLMVQNGGRLTAPFAGGASSGRGISR